MQNHVLFSKIQCNKKVIICRKLLSFVLVFKIEVFACKHKD